MTEPSLLTDELLKLSDDELMRNEKALVMDNPLRLVEYGYLFIKTKEGSVIKLELNSVQKRFLCRVKEIMAAGKAVRLWVLKARAVGISTIIQAITYAYTSQGEGINSLVVAHDIDGSNNLFSMQKLFQEKLDVHLRPQIKHSNEKKLEFDHIHSQVLIDTSDNLATGRSFTLRIVHLSEVSRFRDLKTLMLSINQAVPKLPGTFIICETTANGMNQFYDEWVSCGNAQVEGLTDWQTFFIPWFEVLEYSMSLEFSNGALYPIEGIDFKNPIDKENFIIDESILRQKYGLTLEQMNWRRWCIVNNCNRSVLQFLQEYPSSELEAFTSTGDLFFDKTALGRQEIRKPLAMGNIVRDGKYVFRADTTGLFKIYEMPVREGQYVVAADPAEGLEHGDKSACVVLNKRTNKTACVYNHNIPPDRFEEDLIKIGHFYNDAIIACESKGYGYSINQGLYKSYGRVYRKVKTKKGFGEHTLELGFNTNRMTRPQMLAQLQDEIANGATELLDKDLIQQCWTFVNNVKRGEPEGEKGKSDDLVLARAIGGQVRMEQPFKDKFFNPSRQQKRFRGLSGY